MKDSKRSFWLTPNGLAAIGLPYLILLLCPVMHIFMHGGHGGHGNAHHNKEDE